ncbi:hypothetical protein L1987_39383 [Smallanthus sonchifolius]|uniref:Uncharacterized protein n=1 Tax=Smallanthus sonchifolius TaxID=185202 RepID=A0ACB9HLA3_9ASTR|nr:hypothetical protein L1987_39383 [Smallanthus sonchifolius]
MAGIAVKGIGMVGWVRDQSEGMGRVRRVFEGPSGSVALLVQEEVALSTNVYGFSGGRMATGARDVDAFGHLVHDEVVQVAEMLVPLIHVVECVCVCDWNIMKINRTSEVVVVQVGVELVVVDFVMK